MTGRFLIAFGEVNGIVMPGNSTIHHLEADELAGDALFLLPLEDVAAAIEDVGLASGYGIVRGYVGHGIGNEMHEEPQVTNYRTGRRGRKVEVGLCIAIEPMFTIGSYETRVKPDGWTVYTALRAHEGGWLAADYDELVRELRQLEVDHPDLATDDSPTGQVGGAISATFSPVTHRVPMMSLDNAMDADELRAWADRVVRGLDGTVPTFVCELKFDGLAMSLRYEHGNFIPDEVETLGVIGHHLLKHPAVWYVENPARTLIGIHPVADFQ